MCNHSKKDPDEFMYFYKQHWEIKTFRLDYLDFFKFIYASRKYFTDVKINAIFYRDVFILCFELTEGP